MIVGVVCERDDRHFVAFRRVTQDFIPRIASGLFGADTTRASECGDVDNPDLATDSELLAQRLNPNGVFVGLSPAQLVIDVDGNRSEPQFVTQQTNAAQQRDAVGTSGDSDNQRRFCRDGGRE